MSNEDDNNEMKEHILSISPLTEITTKQVDTRVFTTNFQLLHSQGASVFLRKDQIPIL